MSRNKVVKIFILLLVLSLIVIQSCRVGAMSIGEILGEGNETSNLQQSNNTPTDLLNTAGNTATPTNTATNSTPITAPINSLSNNTATNTNKSLPKTGTNENIIIGLMVICTIAGIYAFKKVKEYNM